MTNTGYIEFNGFKVLEPAVNRLLELVKIVNELENLYETAEAEEANSKEH